MYESGIIKNRIVIYVSISRKTMARLKSWCCIVISIPLSADARQIPNKVSTQHFVEKAMGNATKRLCIWDILNYDGLNMKLIWLAQHVTGLEIPV